MKVVTTDFDIAQKRPDSRPVRIVEYKRRKWSQTTQAFIWETSWTEMPINRIASVSEVNWQLDTDQLNEFKVSNVTLVLRNNDGYFNPDNPDGFFGQDDDSPFYQYEIYWTKFRIRAGFTLADGTSEIVTIFTGLLAPDPIYESDMKNVQFPLQGLEATLLNTKAEEIATTVTAENKGVGNSVTTEFTTTNPGVGAITQVTLNGTAKVEGSDYSVSQLNESALGAKVTFTVAPTAAQTIRISYFYWPQGFQFHELVEALLDAAGIADANQDVQSVVFENSVLNEEEFSSQTEWNTGTLSGLESTSSPGDIVPDYYNSIQTTTYTQSTTGWTGQESGTSAGPTSDGTSINWTGGNPAAFLRYWRSATIGSMVIGAWQARLNSFSMTIGFKSNFSSGAINGYRVIRAGGIFYFHKIAGDDSIGVGSALASWTEGAGPFDIRIVRTEGGVFKIYEDAVLKATVTDTTYTTFNAIQFLATGSGARSFRDVRIPNDPVTGTWVSPVIDLNATPSAWGAFGSSHTEDGATITYETRTSTDGLSFDAYVAVVNGQPQSAFKRYGQIRITISFAASTERSPSVSDVIFRWSTSGVPVTLPAAFTGQNVYDAIRILGEYTNYEFGFDPDEVFFFRPKTAGDSVMDVSQADQNARIYGYSPGYDRMRGSVRVTYGEITKEVTDNGDSPGSPKARVADNRDDFTPDSGIIIPASADIASGVAAGRFAYLSKRRARFKLSTKFLPQLDLSDVITVTFANVHPPKLWYLGDNNVNQGDKEVFHWGEKEQLAFNTEAKIIGARYDTERFACEFDLEEVA